MGKQNKRVYVSAMTGKLEGFLAINTNPFDNSFCMRDTKNTICEHCYSKKMLNSYRKNCVNAFHRNSIALSKHQLSTDELPVFKPGTAIRFNAHGEVHNSIHVRNIFAIAQHNPECVFALWTKRPKMIPIKEKPSNLILIFSGSEINKTAKIPSGFNASFSVYKKDMLPIETKNVKHCKQKCSTCMVCYTNSLKEIQIVEKIK